MDRQLAERMVGAACLLAVLVLVVPSILDGDQQPGRTDPEPVLSDVPDLRTYTLSLDSAERVPPVPQLRNVTGEAAGTLPIEDSPVEATAAPRELHEVQPAAAPEPEKPPVAETASVKTVAAPPAAAPPAAPAGQWYVQLGSFSNQQNAEGLAKKLKAKGFDVAIRKTSNGSLSRVLVGPRADRDAAVDLAKKLSGAGFKGQPTRL
jgi:DedD protein